MKWAHIIQSVFCVALCLNGCQSPKKIQPLECNHLTPLQAGIPGSPENLITLKNRPTGVSELAALMREMLKEMKTRRSQIKGKQPVDTLPNYEKIKCSWPTEMNTRSAKFDELANLTLAAMKNFNHALDQSSYNSIVAACITCHQTSCPGPMAAIRPLVLGTGDTLLPLKETQTGSCEAPLDKEE